MADELEANLLSSLLDSDCIPDSSEFASSQRIDHGRVVGLIKSLQSDGLIIAEGSELASFELTEEGASYQQAGSPEAQVWNSIPEEGVAVTHAVLASPLGKIGQSKGLQKKWLFMDKSSTGTLVKRKVDSITDTVQEQLSKVLQGQHQEVPSKELADLKKRKMIRDVKRFTYRVAKGPEFALQRRKAATDLTADMLAKGTWKEEKFKAYNFNALGQPTAGGHLHPLLKVRTQFRKIFTQMGFQEMATNAFVESSFWNFDALFQPQQHPARDAHDTFFLTHPARAPICHVPEDYLNRVRQVHERGGYGSEGYGTPWKVAEAEKNLLRTHTTAVSSRMLYKLAQEGFRPAKYFSIDRVFRNEAVDRTHLAEFHQIEGVVCDIGLTLGHLIGILKLFFTRLGLPKLRFKPAYNPYTEPSMEIFSYSEELKKWIEVGNSGMFRPEMLRPMGLPENVNVIAWGLGLERPTMILYGIDNIRDLFGHKVNLGMVKRNPICRLGF
ncbi:hypothetical protein WJX74_003786 [Apatococcus lobatus]|uniref:phenylalanine--tRNA ligase n=1 Tax=Apatococcus lobatus TaxID=904363 RepID=A0AAW1QM82_9CHLO